MRGPCIECEKESSGFSLMSGKFVCFNCFLQNCPRGQLLFKRFSMALNDKNPTIIDLILKNRRKGKKEGT